MPLTDSIFLQYPLGINRRNFIIREINSIFSLGLAKDKARFKQLIEEHGIAVPRTFHEIRDFSAFDPAGFFPDEFVLKPNQGMGGNGILILKREEDSFITPSGEKYSADHLRSHIRKVLDGEFSGYMEKDTALIEERIYSSARLQFKDALGLPDIRVFCYEFEPVMGMFRYATAESRGRANLSQGAIGMGIDLTGGTITHIHAKNEKKPLTAEEFGIPPSFTIPKWEEIKAIARKAARLSQLQIAGVDVILDARDTVMVLEINGHPGLEIQNVNERSLWQSMSLVAERLDRVERRRFSGRVEAEEDPYPAGEDEGDGNRLQRDQGRPLQEFGDGRRSPHSEHNADDSTARGEKDRLGQELKEDVALLGAYRHADADLPGPLR
ncbi:MAG: hypothetical protein EHM36_10770, partial [Deltaproteobacteria bacterium]